MKEEGEFEQNNPAQCEQYWKEKEKLSVPVKINAHQCIIASKSTYFSTFFVEARIN